MVHVEFWRPGSEIGRSECVATLTQRGRSQPQIEGREPQVVDLERVVLSVSTGEAIRWMTRKSGHAASPAPTARRTCSPRSSSTMTPTVSSMRNASSFSEQVERAAFSRFAEIRDGYACLRAQGNA